MDFNKTDEQVLLLDSVREWCNQNINEEKMKAWYKAGGVSDDLYQSWADAVFAALGVPEEYGGTPVDNLTLMMLTEEVSRAAGGWMALPGNVLLLWDLMEIGTPEQVKLIAEPYMKTGKGQASMALSEPGAGSDNQGMTTVAKEIDGKIHITGQKTWVSNGASQPYVLVIAKDEDPSRENKNFSLWMMPLDTPGITTSPLTKIGNHIFPMYDMYFDDVVVDKSALVGERGKGFLGLMKNFEIERILVPARCLGIAQACMEDAAAYTTQRQTFGKPIASYQLIQEKLTDMEIKLRNSRNMIYHAAWKVDNGESIQLDQALIKRYASVALTQVCDDAIQIFGGLGYTEDTRVGRGMLDCRGMMIGGGTPEIMVHIAGRLLAKQYAK